MITVRRAVKQRGRLTDMHNKTPMRSYDVMPCLTKCSRPMQRKSNNVPWVNFDDSMDLYLYSDLFSRSLREVVLVPQRTVVTVITITVIIKINKAVIVPV